MLPSAAMSETGSASTIEAARPRGGVYEHRVYANQGNQAVMAMVPRAAVRMLDVGCGAGDNARLLRERDPHKQIDGVSASSTELALAAPQLHWSAVVDLERELPEELRSRRYDVVLCSHVLEHLTEPWLVVARLGALLEPDGELVIAVPNVLFWRERVKFIAGRFEYASSGTLDETHLRFFTYDTADRYLLRAAPELKLIEKHAVGNVPLWLLRRHLLSKSVSATLDRLGSKHYPNLFGDQILLRVARR
jgi:2-polyprenyl-3-methyl-5-hydroxy-6-metoxy-1,4-benzoquinol methylase